MGMTGVVSGALSTLRSARTVAQWKHVPLVSASAKTASVLAVVPARDEEAALPSLLSGLVGQPGVRVVVVDDASRDATAEVARSHGVEVIESSGPPAGWAGKVAYNRERMETHGVRRAAEMEEAAKTLLDLGIEPVMTRGTVALQRRAAKPKTERNQAA